jgi:uncharacterized protein YoxC
LSFGDASKISPEDRYKFLGAEVNALLPKVQSGDKKALGEWTKISQEYLESSQDYNATNLQYFKDLEFIKQHTDAAAIYAQSQVDVAQLQLDLMGDQLSALRTLNGSVLDVVSAINGANSSSTSSAGSVSAASSMSGIGITAAGSYGSSIVKDIENLGGKDALLKGAESGDPYGVRNLQLQLQRWNMMDLKAADIDQILGKGWMDKFLKSLGIPADLFDQRINFMEYIRQNMQKIPGFAKGGIANGLAMVGENGAELVNFKSPARVYNANDTKSILGGNSESSKETNDLLKKQNSLMERLISKLEGASDKQIKAVSGVAQKIGVVNANAKFEKAST